jgi:hypothetical protein
LSNGTFKVALVKVAGSDLEVGLMAQAARLMKASQEGVLQATAEVTGVMDDTGERGYMPVALHGYYLRALRVRFLKRNQVRANSNAFK